MVPEVLGGVLWLARLGFRTKHCGARAEHGYADPGYRPATVPFVSLVGPLTVEAEPERDLPPLGDILIQLPGYELGAARTAEVVPAGATLRAVFDGSANATVVLSAGDFSTQDNAVAMCASIEAAFRAAVAAGGFADGDGAPVIDPARLAELDRITCRWDEARRAVALSSGRRGPVEQLFPSSVVVTGGTAASPAGLMPPAHTAPGRYVRQHIPAPKGYALDIRLDLWAASQRDLGYLVEELIRAVPMRTRIATRPGLLAADLIPGVRALRLLPQGEPTSFLSLLHLEASDSFLDRVSGLALTTTPGATAEVDPPRLAFAGTGTAQRLLVATASIPDPSRPTEVAPAGAALSLGLRLATGAAGDQGRIFTVEQAGRSLLRLDFAVVEADGALFVDLTAAAELQQGSGGFGLAATTRRVNVVDLQAGAVLHLAVNAAQGAVVISLNGTAQNFNDATETPETPTTVAPGVPPSGEGLRIVLGNPAGNPVSFELDHVHLLAAPLPPHDPRLRGSVSTAPEFRPGDYIALGVSDNGFLVRDDPEGFYVKSVFGDTVTLDRPVSRRWRRGATLVHSRCCFLHQRSVKRRDDLMNRLYRYCVSYRVSALLENPVAASVGSLVLEPMVEVEARNIPRPPAHYAPGVRSAEGDFYPFTPFTQE
jgi:hypothetical protein